jgi:hypothetical protein
MLWSGVAFAQTGPPIVIAPGPSLNVHGTGCAPGADVRVTLTASHATGRTLDTFPADASGSFSRSVVIPDAGEPQAAVIAECIDASNNNIEPFFVNITYKTGTLPATGSRLVSREVLMAAVLLGVGATLLWRGNARSATAQHN